MGKPFHLVTVWMHWRKSQEKIEQGSQKGKAPESEQHTSTRTSGYRKHKTAFNAAARCLHFLPPNHELSISQGARLQCALTCTFSGTPAPLIVSHVCNRRDFHSCISLACEVTDSSATEMCTVLINDSRYGPI